MEAYPFTVAALSRGVLGPKWQKKTKNKKKTNRDPNLDFQVANRDPNLDFQVANRDPNLDFQVCFHLSL